MSIDQNMQNMGAGPSPLDGGQPAYIPVVGVETGALVKRAFLFLEDGEFYQAARYAEQALTQDPANGRAALGKLMAELGLHTEDELANVPTPLSGHPLFQTALQFGPPDQQVRLMALAQAWQARVAAPVMPQDPASAPVMLQPPTSVPGMAAPQPAVQTPNVPPAPAAAPAQPLTPEDRYASAVGLMSGATTAEEFLSAAQMFDALGMYQDARMLAWNARKSAKEITERAKNERKRKQILLAGVAGIAIVAVLGGRFFFGRASSLSRGSATASAEASNIVSDLRSMKAATLMFYADYFDR
ncbi:MAG: hypothetical protein IJR68_12920 [Fretibacterium sp.]|nr:hypothetical protein [Fretibacterium sp.]MBR0179050.1 hypothetical protein [Bacillota bacterium]